MKKLFTLLAVAAVMVACGGDAKKDNAASYETQVSESLDAVIKAINNNDYDAFTKAMDTYDKLYPETEDQVETFTKVQDSKADWDKVDDVFYDWVHCYRTNTRPNIVKSYNYDVEDEYNYESDANNYAIEYSNDDAYEYDYDNDDCDSDYVVEYGDCDCDCDDCDDDDYDDDDYDDDDYDDDYDDGDDW